VHLKAGTRIAAAYGSDIASESYHCRYGLNAEFRAGLLTGPLCEAAADDAGAVRAIELRDHPFFVATLFQPERAALRGERVALVEAFVRALAG
jgi:CTP synthase (UTP-ammonia lyase)